MNKALLFGALALAGVMALPATSALAKATGPVAALDTDNDGTVDLNEVNKSATELFTRLEKDFGWDRRLQRDEGPRLETGVQDGRP